MHCPNCGKPASTDQQFCRACGMNLENVGKLVTQHVGTPAAKLQKAELEQAIVRSMFNWLMWGMLIIGIGVVMLVLNKNFDFGKMFGLVSSLLVLGGTGVAAAGVLNGIKRGASISGRRPANQLSSSLPDTKSLNNPIPAELTSVTERTTQLIGVEDGRTNKMMDSKPRE
jgi:hypothetical protein